MPLSSLEDCPLDLLLHALPHLLYEPLLPLFALFLRLGQGHCKRRESAVRRRKDTSLTQLAKELRIVGLRGLGVQPAKAGTLTDSISFTLRHSSRSSLK